MINFNFIGIGAQKSGTSWIYACLYEHPEICAPIKEIHFFSRDRFQNGQEWYESHFKNCKDGSKQGEFSTSYLYSPEAAERIHALYPDVKVIAALRNPVDRAYSQYINAVKAGDITTETSFEEYLNQEKSVVAQGLYAKQLERYTKLFSKDQLLTLVYEDSVTDPEAYMKTIYQFLDIDTSFVAIMLHKKINVARIPKSTLPEKVMQRSAEFLRRIGLDKLVWTIRKSGLPELVRGANTESAEIKPTFDRKKVAAYFRDDTEKLSQLIGRDMVKEWSL